MPIFYGIQIDGDKELQYKLRDILTEITPQLRDYSKSYEMLQMLAAFKNMWVGDKPSFDGWHRPSDYHVKTHNFGK